MNRRESLQQLFGGFAAVSAVGAIGDVPVSLQAVDPPKDSKPEVFILNVPGHISNEAVDRIKAHWKRALNGTVFQDSVLIILGDGMRLERVPRA